MIKNNIKGLTVAENTAVSSHILGADCSNKEFLVQEKEK